MAATSSLATTISLTIRTPPGTSNRFTDGTPTSAEIDSAATGQPPLSFVTAQGPMFARWMAEADTYQCAEGGGGHCSHKKLRLRRKACEAVKPHYSQPAAVAGKFSVVISYAPFRKRLRVLKRIEAALQTVPEVHTIFLVLQGPDQGGDETFVPSGPKPVEQARPAFDALGNRFGPLRIPTDGVLIMDDDVLLHPLDISHALSVLKDPNPRPLLQLPTTSVCSNPAFFWQTVSTSVITAGTCPQTAGMTFHRRGHPWPAPLASTAR